MPQQGSRPATSCIGTGRLFEKECKEHYYKKIVLGEK
jgi:hypothetical protein